MSELINFACSQLAILFLNVLQISTLEEFFQIMLYVKIHITTQAMKLFDLYEGRGSTIFSR